MNDDRGMMKWLSYKSLVEQEAFIKSTLEEQNKIDKPLLSQDEKMVINDFLVNYHGERIILTYYKDGAILSYNGTIKIDTIYRKIYTEDFAFPLNNLLSIKFE